MNVPSLQRVIRLDSIPLNSTYFTEEGYLKDMPIVTSVGIFEYTNPDGSIRRELRLPEEVFKPESLASYEGKPIIITHSAGYVNKDNVDDEHVGTILSKGIPDGDDVRAKIVIHNIDAVKRTGTRELSLGYELALDESPGEWNGQPYDAIQRNIMVNHLAIVRNARAGEQARLNIDSRSSTTILKGGKSMSRAKRTDSVGLTPEQVQEAIALYLKNQTAAVDNEDPDTPDGAVDDAQPTDTGGETPMTMEEKIEAIKEHRDRRDSDNTPLEDVVMQLDSDIDTLLEVIDELQAKEDFNTTQATDQEGLAEGGDEHKDEDEENKDSSDSEAKTMNEDSVDRLVSEKLAVARIGDSVGLSGLEKVPLRKAKIAVIQKVNPNMRLDGKNDSYVNAAYAMACDSIGRMKSTQKQVKKMYNQDSAKPVTGTTSADEARQQMIKRRQNGGK